MAEPSVGSRTTGPSWLAWVGGTTLITVAGVAFLLWGIRGGAIILDLIAAYCF